MTTKKRTALTRYADQLRQRLSADIPLRHQHRLEAYKRMLEIDLKKTLARLNN